MARSGPKRGDTRSAQTRTALIEAAIAALAEVGFSGASARAVADRAGVAPGGVFYHFRSMDELLAAVFDTCLERRIGRLRAAVDVPRDELPAAFSTAVRAEFAHVESRAVLELVVGAIDSPALSARVRAGFAQSSAFTREVVELLLADSPFAALLPLDLVAQVATSAFFGLAVMDLVGSDVDIDGMTTLVTGLLELMRSGFATPPG
jgi:AcrR family transcriptional regulator